MEQRVVTVHLSEFVTVHGTQYLIKGRMPSVQPFRINALTHKPVDAVLIEVQGLIETLFK